MHSEASGLKYSMAYSPKQIESHLSAAGIDPEKLEEKFDPGIHQKLESYYMEHEKHKRGRHTHTVVDHHHDGSHTSHKHFEDGSKESQAHGDLDGVHDMLEESQGTPNPGEPEAEGGDHGIPDAHLPSGMSASIPMSNPAATQ